MSKREYTSHPSWGMIGFSRMHRSGGAEASKQLFGSRLHDHPTTIRLTVKRAERSHDLGKDWIHGTQELIEVELSAAQFADLLTSLNVGDGVPCTIRWYNGHVEPMPAEDTEVHRTREYFNNTLGKIGDRLRSLSDKANNMLTAKGTLTVEQRKAIASDIRMLIQEVEKDIPFCADSFRQVTTKMAAEAKAEVEAFTTTALTRLGFESLKEMQKALETRQAGASELSEGEVEDIDWCGDCDRAIDKCLCDKE